jgi:hypothetical protein
MGFDPQTADKPIVDVKKDTTKVNLVMVVAVVIFLLAAAFAGVWASKKWNHQQPALSSDTSPSK